MTVFVEDDGALESRERITFAFDGDFSGAFRDIPLRDGESITRRAGQPRMAAPIRRAAPTELG